MLHRSMGTNQTKNQHVSPLLLATVAEMGPVQEHWMQSTCVKVSVCVGKANNFKIAQGEQHLPTVRESRTWAN